MQIRNRPPVNLRRSAPRVLQHAKTLRISLYPSYTQKWGRLPKIGLGLWCRTFGADLRSFLWNDDFPPPQKLKSHSPSTMMLTKTLYVRDNGISLCSSLYVPYAITIPHRVCACLFSRSLEKKHAAIRQSL